MAVIMMLRNLTKSIVIGMGRGRMTRTGGKGTRKIDIGVGVEVGQKVGVGMGMKGGNSDMNQIVVQEKAGIVRGEVVIVANHVHIDMNKIVCHQVIGRTRNSAGAKEDQDILQSLVLHHCPSDEIVIEGKREEGIPGLGPALRLEVRNPDDDDHLPVLVLHSPSRGRGPWVRGPATAATTDPATRGWSDKVVFLSIFIYSINLQKSGNCQKSFFHRLAFLVSANHDKNL